MSTPFVHLRLHTEYSLVDSVVRITPLMKRAAELGMPAVAMTDAGNLFALVKFYGAAEAAGIKPVIGIDLNFAFGAEQPADIVTAIVCGQKGYRSLCDVVSRSYSEGQRTGRPVVQADWLGEATPELILLAGRHSPLARSLAGAGADFARQRLLSLKARFPHGVYLELTRTGRPGEENWNASACALAVATGTPVVATNDVRFLTADDYDAHEARVAIHQGYKLTDAEGESAYSREQYLKSGDEMAAVFADLPQALEAGAAIAERASFALDLGHPMLPNFPLADGEDENARLRRDAEAGLAKRLASGAFQPATEEKAYHDRLGRELEVILETGFAGYFLIVADFIAWARGNAVPVGPGRGSGAGSVVAWALGITDLDPLAYDLLFERFLNPERVSMPDFDIDFCMEGRDRVIEYVAERYGRERVSQIITYGTMAARAVVRDTGRVLGHPYGFVDRIAKLVPFEIGMTLERALEESEELAQACREDEEVRSLIVLARKLEGLARNAGKHAGGVVIAPSALTDFTPLYAESNGAALVTQLDKNDVEAIGLVKFDFLGLRTLTILDWAEKAVNAALEPGEPEVSVRELAIDDPDTYKLLQSCETTAVFQLESGGMKELMGRLVPDRFEDIVAVNALFRPGPLQSGMVDDFIARKRGEQKVVYPHPGLEPILKPTYGVILYQEQVMQIAQVLAGYTLGGADLLRRAMGKKKPEEMARQREIFMKGATENGVDERVASHIFDLMEKFAGYGFNKSHSVAYALLAYQTAWMKAHHPAAYMAAVLSADMDHTDKIVRLVEECRRMGLAVLPPHVNHSDYAFRIEGRRAIRYGLGAIKGLGRGAVESLVADRERQGAYRDLADLCARADPGRLNRRAFEALIQAGALDGLGAHRAAMMIALASALAAAEQRHQAGASGQSDFFGQVRPSAEAVADVRKWGELERLAHEKSLLGLYLSGHPMQVYGSLVEKLGVEPIAPLARAPSEGAGSRPVRVAGIVRELRRFPGRRVVTLDDGEGMIEIKVEDELAERDLELLAADRIVVVDGLLKWDNYFNRWRVAAGELCGIESVAEREANCVWIEWRPNGAPPADCAARLKDALSAYAGGGKASVALRFHGRGAGACMRLGKGWQVSPHRELIASLKGLEGVERVEITYQRRSPG
ncbi:MAG: DNA polymerase III subunit alpha [Gammaproteobacteria bacterium]|nr:DNA polymerase III subunit alpha [Gammaproteobacteria bacterium]